MWLITSRVDAEENGQNRAQVWRIHVALAVEVLESGGELSGGVRDQPEPEPAHGDVGERASRAEIEHCARRQLASVLKSPPPIYIYIYYS